MECADARRLIDGGLRPGSTDPRRAALGFHLAGCQACRRYSQRGSDAALLQALLHERPADTGLLQALLNEPPPPAAPEAFPPVLHRPLRPGVSKTARSQHRGKPRPWLRYGLIGAATLLLAVLLWPLATAAVTISGNLQAMRITTAPAHSAVSLASPSAISTPAIVVPSATIGPSATPQPAAGVLDAPPGLPAVVPDRGAAEGVAASPTAPAAQASPVRLPAIGGAAALPTLMPTVDVPAAVQSGEPVTILLLGSDRRPGESWETRSDAIVVVRLDPARQRVAMLSLPRDLIVAIPGYGSGRINAATVYGETYPQLGGGAELARQTVSQLLGIPIQHVVRADFSAFVQAVDAIGGVDIDVQQELYDPQYPTMDYGYMIAHFLPGPQHMDGNTALIYSRMRHMDSDYARARRQQEVLLAIMRRVRQENVLGQARMLADLSTALRDNVQTDLSLDQMIGLAWAARGIAPEQVERFALDENLVYEGGIPGDPYASLPAPGAINLVVGQLLGSQ